MDLGGPMRVESINWKKYILVIVDDYSRFKWVKFLRSNDEAPDAINKCIKNIQVRLNATVRNVRIDNGTEFVNQTLGDFYENVSISHQTFVARTPQQNDVVKRQNRTLVEAARTMLIFSKAPLFLWDEAIHTACYTQNCSLICLRYNKTLYELMHDKKPDLSFLHVFGSLCYLTNDSEDLGKLNAKANIGIFVGYAPTKKAFRIYNMRTQKNMKTIHVTFDELTTMDSVQFSSGPGLQSMTPATSSSGLVPNPIHRQPLAAAPRVVDVADSPVSTSIDQDAPSTSISSPQEQEYYPTKDHPIANVIRDPSRSVSTRKQLETDAMCYYFDAFLTSVEPKNFKQAITEPSWIDAMQEEIHKFERLQVWELVSCPDKVMLIKLKRIYKVKTDGFGGLREEVYVFQPEGFVDQDNPSHVYKLNKALYGLKQAPRSSNSVDTPMIEKNKLDEDLKGTQLMLHFTAKPIEKHLHAVKRIFRYLKGTINMVLWYSKDTDMSLKAYLDADHARCQDTRRSTSGSAQFLGDKLVSWSSKKQKSTAILSLEAERNMNPVAAQQVALDNALVAPEKGLKIDKCNARIEFSKPQREETYQIILDALKLSMLSHILDRC
nr:retrovirus-related Pol polyprotein from transposon TNT 1-94 [Tanacetum cinerariifolium]